MTTPRALLYGGPRDQAIVPIASIATAVRFPRYRDDGTLVHDVYVYEFDGVTIVRDTPAPFRYAGEQEFPPPDPAALEPTRRERRREYWARLGRAILGRD